MSFSSEVKQEMCQLAPDPSEARAMLCAVFLLRASMSINLHGTSLVVQSENARIINFIYHLLVDEYGCEPVLSVVRKMNLKKNNIYKLQFYDQVNEILEDLTILRESGMSYSPSYRMIRSEKMARAFLQGCFLAAGSVNPPGTANYHLEIACPHEETAECIEKQMTRFGIAGKIIQRKGLYVVYLKSGERIADFLRLLKANEALMEFEHVRIQRDFVTSLNRLDNCEVANEIKSIKAGAEQLGWIETIEKHWKQPIPEKIAHVMEARKRNPEGSMNELCQDVKELYGETISKSGMKHRMGKIREMAAAAAPRTAVAAAGEESAGKTHE